MAAGGAGSRWRRPVGTAVLHRSGRSNRPSLPGGENFRRDTAVDKHSKSLTKSLKGESRRLAALRPVANRARGVERRLGSRSNCPARTRASSAGRVPGDTCRRADRAGATVMLSVSGQVKVFLALQPTDMRKRLRSVGRDRAKSAPARSAFWPPVRVSLQTWRPSQGVVLEHARLRAVVHSPGARHLPVSDG